jgi:transposase InsO family protein
MTDNGSAYVSQRFRQVCKRWGGRRLRTQPSRPETNGKAERFIPTMIRGWAYRRPYQTSNQCTKALPRWLRYYNERKPLWHSA